MKSAARESVQPPFVAVLGGYVWSASFAAAPVQASCASELDWTRRLDPLSIKAVQCASEARRSAGLPQKCDTPNQEGVCVATAWGAQQVRLRYASRLVTHGVSGTNPIDFPDSIDGAPAAHVALQCGLQGPSFTFVGGSDCAHQALVVAARQLMLGLADRMHVVVGDLYEPQMAAAVSSRFPAGSQHVAASGGAPMDVVVALVLERVSRHCGCDSPVRLVGYEKGGGEPAASEASPSWLDATGAQAAARIAGAWLGLTAPMGCAPFACQDEALPDGSRRCPLTNRQWPQLALVRTEN